MMRMESEFQGLTPISGLVHTAGTNKATAHATTPHCRTRSRPGQEALPAPAEISASSPNAARITSAKSSR